MAEIPQIIVVGAGVMGCGTAYWLTREGYKVLVLEQESIACGASGMAAAMLESVGHTAGSSVDDPMVKLARSSFALHQELARQLPEESGVDIGYRENPVIYPAFTSEEAVDLKPRQLAGVRWLEGQNLWEVEPRLNRKVLGALVSSQAQVLAYRFVLALATAAERRGMVMRHGEVVGLAGHAGQVTGVQLRNGDTIPAETVVLAMGPWSQRVANWVGLHIPIYPVRGQLLELRVPDPQLKASISHGGMYLVHKADGITLAGTTEEHDSGFANHRTAEGRQVILDGALRLAPGLEEAEVQDQISGLRPCPADGLPLIGPVPGWQGVYMVTGHFRSGMLLSAISTSIIAELIITGHCPQYIDAFNPGRFGQAES